MSRTVLLFSIDGMRPDALQQADTPIIDRVIAQGCATMQARTVMPSVTLPCHTSMLRGVDTPRHGITTNVFQPLARPVPSVLDVAHAMGKHTGFFYNWGELRDLCDPVSLHVAYFCQDTTRPEGDWRVARAAATHLRQEPFDFLFVYLGHTDDMGHKHGWMSQPYLDAIANADQCVGHVLAACRETGQSPVVLLLSDHGGHGQSHGTESPEDMTIPWIIAGTGVRQGITLQSPVRIFDTGPTIAHILEIPPAPAWEGKPVLEAFAAE